MTELEQMRRDFAGLALENLKLRAEAGKLAEALRYAQEHGNTRETWQRIDEALAEANAD
jgi:hypothetical protein